MSIDKKAARLRRSRQTRRKANELHANRLSVFRSNLHIYAQIISDDGNRVLVSASTVEPEVRSSLAGESGKGGNASAASVVGKRVAEKALKAGIENMLRHYIPEVVEVRQNAAY